jgi:hypothetical protein
VPGTVPEDLADQQDRVISARVPRAEYLADERPGGPQHDGPQRDKATHAGTEKKQPA